MGSDTYKEIHEAMNILINKRDSINQNIANLSDKLITIKHNIADSFAEKYGFKSCWIHKTEDQLIVEFVFATSDSDIIKFFYPGFNMLLKIHNTMLNKEDMDKFQDMLVEIKTQLILNGILKP